MKDNFDTINSYSFTQENWNEENSLSESKISDIENEICHLRTLSVYEDRVLARKLYSKIKARMSSIKDVKEKMKLNQLALMINMKVKRV